MEVKTLGIITAQDIFHYGLTEEIPDKSGTISTYKIYNGKGLNLELGTKPLLTKSDLFCSNLVPLKCKLPKVAGSELDVDESWGEFQEELGSKEAAWKESLWEL
ncbi:hypothetical protein DUI87_15914 [Hirundo rustica rustica]|uniref:Uncharacterized protein n=1 Tax=Hirundo rustica rustica TaxID=333673 RepID=A0A3M0JZR2_HIRRU|nr:hypothetical protein DUI87_15914 [Hirundo rustica rustica]